VSSGREARRPVTAPVSHQKRCDRNVPNAIEIKQEHRKINEAERYPAAHNGLVSGSSPAGLAISTSAKERNRHEHPRRQQSASACVAGRHPVFVHGLDDRWDIGVGVAQKFFGLWILPCRSEQRMPLVVHITQQDR